jgi:phosphonate transport system substrate-binding protein
MNRFRCWPVWAVVFLLCGTAHGERELRFGAYTSDKPTEMVREFRPTLNLLEHFLSRRQGETVTIRMVVAGSYAEGVDDLVQGRVEFSQFGPVSYVKAKAALPELQILAMETNKGAKSFNGVIVVRADSAISQVEELRGKRFAFGDDSSTIGRYLSQLYLLEHGVHSGDLKRYDYLQRHDAVAAAVANGRYDAGALKEGALVRQNRQGPMLRPIATFPNVTKPWVAHPSLPQGWLEALRASLLEVDDPAALDALGADGFALGEDGEYDEIRRAVERNPEFFRE